MLRKLIYSGLLLLACKVAAAQELQAKVTVLSQAIGSTVNKNVFNTMQTQLTNMLNSRKWTKDVFQTNEKITCNFLINLQSVSDDNIFKASLTIQAARPVFNSSYQSPLINYQDVDFTFKYQEYQPVEFNESRVGGTDALAGNLTAVMAFYVYMILGLDYDSFSQKGGEEYFKKAQNIVNNAPEDKNISGWKPFDGNRNRYWLAGNVVNPKLNAIHDVFYAYYRTGLDLLYEDETTAKVGVLDALSQLQDFNQQNPNTMIMQFFLQNRSEEFIGIFKKADPLSKSKAREILSKLDVGNATKYSNELK
ncbi:MAG TPA: DUF4835 family protein [Panacibacter sp.]|nr:DUF4835 family protein [Panacibacter sp.]HNP43529.1 DUF4835 family protein [Panacibacter sp.]